MRTLRMPRRRRRRVIGWSVVLAAVIAAVVVPLALTGNHGSTPSFHESYHVNFDQPSTLQPWTRYDDAAPNSTKSTGWWSAGASTVQGGNLVIEARPGSTPQGQRIVTGGVGLYSKPQIYGTYEVRFRADACSQVKYVLLLWPVSGNWPTDGEVDFAEDQGGDRATTIASLLYPAESRFQVPGEPTKAAATSQRIMPPGGVTQWHTLGVEWTPTSIRYTLDGHYWGNPVTHDIPRTRMALVVQTEGLVPASTVSPDFSCKAYVQAATQYAYRP